MTATKKKTYILRVAVPSPLRHTFDYLPPENINLKNIKPGMRVLVPFGKREIVGVILEIANHSEYELTKLRLVTAILDSEPLLPKSILDLINWTSNYYHHPIGDVINNVLPNLLRKKPGKKSIDDYRYDIEFQKKNIQNTIELNEDQKKSIVTIKNYLGVFKTFLLDGVTGSGKTEVYLRVIAEVISKKKQVLVLVPKIKLFFFGK